MHLGSPTLHERCFCRGKHISFCKAHCDDDLNCKGYAVTNDHSSCAFATNAECPKESKCEKHGIGQIGLLEVNGQYGSSFYGKCHIKGKCVVKVQITFYKTKYFLIKMIFKFSNFPIDNTRILSISDSFYTQGPKGKFMILYYLDTLIH